MMITDTHAHIFSASGPFARNARYKPAYEARLEKWVGLWPDAGVTRGVLVQPSFLGTDNRQMLAALEEHPDFLRGVVVVEPLVKAEQLRLWDQAGVRGVRLNLIGISDLSVYGGPEWAQLYRRMATLGWHLEVQCEGERMPSFLSLLPNIPLALVIDHFGLPDPKAGELCKGVSTILRLAGSRSIYVKLSAPYRLRRADARKYAARYLTELGPHRLLWGSDWPWTNHEPGQTYEDCMSALCRWVPSAAERLVILEETPKSLYGFDRKPAF